MKDELIKIIRANIQLKDEISENEYNMLDQLQKNKYKKCDDDDDNTYADIMYVKNQSNC